MSDFQRLPTQDEPDLYDQQWIDDMQYMYTIYSGVRGQAPSNIFDKLVSGDPNVFDNFKSDGDKQDVGEYEVERRVKKVNRNGTRRKR